MGNATGNGSSKEHAFTMLPHDLLDRDAVRVLSPGAFRALVHFLRAWLRKTRNGRVAMPGGIPFAYGGCGWPVKEATWNRYRAELVDHGFITCVSRSRGLFRWSEGYKTLPVSPDNRRRLERHSRRLEKRRLAAYRLRDTTGGAPQGPGSTPSPGNGGAHAPRNGQGLCSPQLEGILPDHTPENGVMPKLEATPVKGAEGQEHG